MTTVLVDCDGVLADLVGPWLDVLDEVHGIRASYDEVTDFEFGRCVCTPEQAEAVWAHIDATPGWGLRLPALPHVAAGLRHLRSWANRVVCVTSPHVSGSWVVDRYRWLFQRGFHRRDIVLASDKSLVAGDALIDDKVDNLREWVKAWPYGEAVTIEHPYNREWTEAAEGDLLTASMYLQAVFEGR